MQGEREGAYPTPTRIFLQVLLSFGEILQGVSTHGPAQKRQDPRGESCQGREGVGEGLEKA